MNNKKKFLACLRGVLKFVLDLTEFLKQSTLWRILILQCTNVFHTILMCIDYNYRDDHCFRQHC